MRPAAPAGDYSPPVPIPEPTVDLDDVPAMDGPVQSARSDASSAETEDSATRRHPLVKPAAAAHPPFGDDDEDLPTMVVPPEARKKHLLESQQATDPGSAAAPEAARDRHPPHTPPSLAKPSLSEDDVERTNPRRRPAAGIGSAAQSGSHPSTPVDADEGDEKSDARMSTFGVVVVVLLLLLALGLVGASLALEGTADPRPLLESLYRQLVQGQ